ncbi:MAG: ATP synthase subunit I [Candidatus Acidiferrales bacterium]
MESPERAENVPESPAPAAQGHVTEDRIGWLTLVVGFSAAAVTGGAGRWQWAKGLAVGTILGWLNFRLLRRGLDALVALSMEQTGGAMARTPQVAFLLAMLRYGLIAVCVYVIFERLRVPLASVLVGLCALGAAAIAASVYEILRPDG